MGTPGSRPPPLPQEPEPAPVAHDMRRHRQTRQTHFAQQTHARSTTLPRKLPSKCRRSIPSPRNFLTNQCCQSVELTYSTDTQLRLFFSVGPLQLLPDQRCHLGHHTASISRHMQKTRQSGCANGSTVESDWVFEYLSCQTQQDEEVCTLNQTCNFHLEAIHMEAIFVLRLRKRQRSIFSCNHLGAALECSSKIEVMSKRPCSLPSKPQFSRIGRWTSKDR